MFWTVTKYFSFIFVVGLGVVACIYNAASLETEFWNSVWLQYQWVDCASIQWVDCELRNPVQGEEPDYIIGPNWDLAMTQDSKAG